MRVFPFVVLVAVLAACETGDASEADSTPAAPASEVVTLEALQSYFPDEVEGLPKAIEGGEVEGALGFEITRATASYTENPRVMGTTLVLNILDMGSPMMTERMGYGWGLDGGTPDTTFAGYPATYSDPAERGTRSVSIIVGERFLIESNGSFASVAIAESAIRGINLTALEALAATPAE
ncbi:MAG: hypothetical protein AAGK21_10975 [Bacteroidota bacterium]